MYRIPEPLIRDIFFALEPYTAFLELEPNTAFLELEPYTAFCT
jgi:hypothetical protein